MLAPTLLMYSRRSEPTSPALSMPSSRIPETRLGRGDAGSFRSATQSRSEGPAVHDRHPEVDEAQVNAPPFLIRQGVPTMGADLARSLPG